MRWPAFPLNPIIQRELRSRVRGRRVFIVLVVHTLLLSLLAGIIYTTVYYEQAYRYTYAATSYGGTPVSLVEYGPTLGKALFFGTVLLLLAIFSFVAPAFGAGAIAGERERQTYDTLLLTNLHPGQIVWGKIGAVFALMLLFIAVSLPVQSLAFLLGGVALIEFVIAGLSLLVSVLAFSAVGLFFSSLARTTSVAVSLAYGLIVPIVYGIPFLVLFLTEGPPSRFFDQLSGLLEGLYTYSMIFLMSINPFFAAILTAEAAADGQGYLIYSSSTFGPVNNVYGVWTPSPWLIYAGFYLLLTVLAVWLATRRVRQASGI